MGIMFGSLMLLDAVGLDKINETTEKEEKDLGPRLRNSSILEMPIRLRRSNQ